MKEVKATSLKVDAFKQLIEKSRKFAKKVGLKKEDVQKIKKKIRNAIKRNP